MEEINKISKSSIIRTIVAWLMGILALLLIVNLLNQIEFIKTLTSSEDSPSMIIILIISAMISIRIGRAIYYGKLNGGVSPRGNKRFMYWIGIIIILGVLGEFVFMLLNAIVGKNIVLIVIVSIFVWVIAFELVRMFSAQISKFIKKWDIFKHKDYYKTLLKAGKYEEALKNIRFFVAKGDMEAEHNLGLMYANGYGVKQDNKEALKWYQKAADQGYDKAENIFGLMYMRGDGVRQDYKEALKWFAKSSEHDNGEAQYNLSIIYYFGLGVPQDCERAMRILGMSAAYHQCDYQKAEFVLEDLDSSNVQFDSEDICELEKMEGAREFLKVYKELIKEGNAEAQFRLGRMYDQSECDELGLPQNEKEALKWLKKSAEQGYLEAQYYLGHLYNTSFIFSKEATDGTESVEWYKKAAEQGHTESQLSLGLMYYEGFGIKQNYKEALKWFKKAAEQNLPLAQYKLGIMYQNGDGVRQDYKEAVKWYEKGVYQGLAEAQFQLGAMYQEGQGLSQDYEKAIMLFKKSAKQDYEYAQGVLGLMYYEGQGVSQDCVQAYKWISLASSQNKEYIEIKDGIEKIMTKEQIAKAQKLASEFIPKEDTGEME